MKKLISIILSLVFVLFLLPLQVFAAPITKVEVTGIDTPVVGVAPDMNATAGNGYYNLANRIQWKEYNESKIYQRDLTASDTFRAGYYYAVFVTVFTDSDMPFTSETTGTINGKSAQMQEPQDNGCSIVLLYNFAEILKEPVKELDLTIPAPVDGEKPDYTKLDSNSYYSDNGLNGTSTRIYKNGIAWYKSTTSAMTPGTGETFSADADYQLKISLLPKEGYFFHENISVMINGKTATVEPFDDGSINVSVTLTAAGPAHTHTPSEWRTTGAYHYKACTTCGEFLDQEDHKGGVATCAEKGKCTVCGYEYIDVHENHTPDTSKWVIRGDMYHYHACKLCGAHCDIGEHVAGPAGTPDAAVVCKDCGYIITPAKDHAHNLTKVAKKNATCTEPGSVEYYTCDGCSDFFADSKGKTKITDTVVAPLGHKVSDDWKHDENNHWRTCTVCNEVLTETQMAHEMNGKKCTTCNYDGSKPYNTPSNLTETTPDSTTPQQQEKGNGGMPWWSLLLIGLGAVVVGGIVGVFVLKQKRRCKHMRKFVSILICLLLLLGLAIPTFAAGVTVTFTADSLPEVGGTLTVDTNALMNNGSITSEMYNALLEGNVIYSWYKNGTLTQEGTGADALSYQLPLSDQGCTFYVKVSFYEDSSFQESKKCGEAVSGEITITGPAPEITTKSLTVAIVGTEYYIRLECSDPDAVFSEFMGSQLSEFGLYLTQHGEIEGTPTKAGNCHINVLVISEGGGENSFSFDLTVNAAPAGTEPDPTPPTSEPPASAPTDAADSTQDTTDVAQPGDQDNSKEFPWWGYVVIAVGGIAVGIGIAFVFVKLKKKD